MIGFDYTARIAPAALEAAGCQIAIRYVMPQTAFWTKTLRNAEAAELLAAGIPIVSNWETTADRMRGGAAAGQQDAQQLLADWQALRAPTGLTGWFSADWDVQPGEVAAVLDYLRAADAVLKPHGYRTGLYGGLRACAAAADAGFGIWQTVAWSGGRWDPRAVVRQTGEQRMVGGVQVDVNKIINLAALGAWGGPTTGADMQLTDSITIPPAAQAAFPDFGFNSPTIDVQAALAWTAARVSHIANHLPAPVDVNALAAAVAAQIHAPAPPPVDVAALAAALVPHLNAGATADQIAMAVVGHLNLTVSAR